MRENLKEKIEVLTRLRRKKKAPLTFEHLQRRSFLPSFIPMDSSPFPLDKKFHSSGNAFSLLLLPFETSEETTLYYIDPVGKEIMSEIPTL